MIHKPEHFILDVDGVFTTGHFLYTESGKFAKIFGPHDNDGIKLLRDKIKIQTITADKRGFSITKRRMDDMNIPLILLSEEGRLTWFKTNFDLSTVIFMGDSMHDAEIFKHVSYSIAPANAFYTAKKQANFVTNSISGEGAVAEACLHILKKFFD